MAALGEGVPDVRGSERLPSLLLFRPWPRAYGSDDPSVHLPVLWPICSYLFRLSWPPEYPGEGSDSSRVARERGFRSRPTDRVSLDEHQGADRRGTDQAVADGIARPDNFLDRRTDAVRRAMGKDADL